MLPFFKKNNSTKTYTRLMCDIIFGIVSITLLFITILVTIITIISSRDNTNNTLRTKVSSYSKEIDNWYLNNINYVNATATALSTNGITDKTKLSLTLKNIISNTELSSLSYVCLAFDDDSFVTTSSNPYKAGEINLSKQTWFVNAINNNENVVTSLPESLDNTGYITFSRSLNIDSKRCVLMFKVSMQELFNITNSYESNNDEYMFLVDNTGRFITHPTENKHFEMNIFSNLDGAFKNVSSVFNSNKTLLFTTKDYDGSKKLVYCNNNLPDSKLTSVGVGKSYDFSNYSIIVLIFCFITYIISALLIYTVIAKKISKYFSPLLSISNKLERISVGDFSINFDNNVVIKEVETLACALNITKSSLNSYLADTKNILHSLSECNLNVDISNDYLYDYVELQDSLSNVAKMLHDTFADINETSLAISYNAEHMQTSSEELSSNADEELTYIKKVVDGIDRLCLKNKVINCKCVGASDLSSKLHDLFKLEHESTINISEALSDVKNYYKKIVQTTNTLSELSVQTDLLSLKASIEASRVGESGKSFSKIATEIGSLAKDCTNAVNYISSFADELTNAVNKSVELSTKISEQISETTSYFSQSAHIIDEISMTVNEQSNEHTQISSSILQISSIIESNKAASNENFSISDEASNQAILLKKIVDKFDFNN